MAASTHPTKHAIVAHLEKVGAASPRAIAEALGPEWLHPPRSDRLRKTLRQMARRHILQCPSRGAYSLHPSYTLRSFDNRDATVRRIEEFLRQRGGAAQTSEIQEAVAGRQRLSHADSTYDHQRVTQALKHSPRFHQDFGHGHWNLPLGEFEGITVPGRLASKKIQVQWYTSGPLDGFSSWMDVREMLFVAVAGTFADARGDLELSEVVAIPGIKWALEDMSYRAPAARARAWEGLKATMMTSGITHPRELAEALVTRRDTELLAHVYAAFENGDTDLHLIAPVELYIECAALFGVCPVSLSHGKVVPGKISGMMQGTQVENGM